MPQPVFETGLPRPQRGVLTTILLRPGDMGYRSPHLSHAKRALYHLSYIPLYSLTHQVFGLKIVSGCVCTDLFLKLFPLEKNTDLIKIY